MVVAVSFDGNQELRKLVVDFGKMPPALRKELRPALQRGAQPILAQSRANSAWSTRIPQATRISPRFAKRRGGIVIVVSSRRAPHARPYENLGDPGTFRHPVFGPSRRRDMVFGRELPGAFKAGYQSRARTAGARRRYARRAANGGTRGLPWVAQRARPFLFRAVEQRGGAVTEALAKTVIEIGRKHGWNR
ncbi:hypothetical protein [Sphaerisporangium sp. TRM90804]|uniref:hypothetical protein n=1 Tax=Sphaerisporangium sp. TRM90804 TaxID=3031113 RepID=UPI00244D0123|nr:hypothetical protein [Sphaerisporangium sp. TRM90804]MDH2425786.1 hypothetical protein [Sphaerisporangium sp. TRM90804]